MTTEVELIRAPPQKGIVEKRLGERQGTPHYVKHHGAIPDKPHVPGEFPPARLLSAHDPRVVVVDPRVGPPQAARAGGVGRCCLCCCCPKRRLRHKGWRPPTSLSQGKKADGNAYNINQRTSFSFPIPSFIQICSGWSIYYLKIF